LFFEFARIIDALRPGWILVENVPGLLSSNGGRDFGVVLGTLADIGYGVAWRILDSRFFGVPQRRRRVFIVGALADGDPRAAAERAGQILAVGQGCSRHLAPRGEARQDAPIASLSGLGSGGPDDNDAYGGRVIAYAGHGEGEAEVANALKVPSHGASWSGGSSDTFVAAPLTKGSATGEGVNQPGRRQEDDVNLVPYTFDWQMGGSWIEGGTPSRSWIQDTPGRTRALVKNKTLALHSAGGVRRLTPTECERLQGFPDGWTQLSDTPDSRRYSALGDAVTVNVSEWIGRRLR
jgi:DNA (cytosine-5)-methyltransferase 1